ncbi:MAG: efflux transporter outer membrane subunit [Pirellulales bacterium]|nr:efflux transporter outer membrane subunit [Pirellulales bacterium]
MLSNIQKAWILLVVAAICLAGCTSLKQYVHNGFKVGPNYHPPLAPVAQHWIDTNSPAVLNESRELCCWWTVFNDPVLNRLVACACRQNLSLKEAGLRVLQARAQLGITVGNLFPQQQDAVASYTREGIPVGDSGFGGGGFFDQWSFGFNLAWELDFWGRFRRAVAAQKDLLDASVEDYRNVQVTLLGDVATNYVQIRIDQQRIKLLETNVEVQRGVLDFIEKRFAARFHVSKLDLDQARSNLKQTEAQIPQLQINMRQSANRLCILLGIPPQELEDMLGEGMIPTSPLDVAAGIPAELLRRRPDIRRAERQAAAQAEEIGIAESDLYPAFTLSGSLGYRAQNFSDLFSSQAFNGNIGPSAQWNILNYGRIVNNVRFQDAHFQELVLVYQNTVLQAAEEVENGLVTFMRSHQQAEFLNESVKASQSAVNIAILQYKTGASDFNRYALIEQNLVQQQDLQAQALGQIALGLIQVYRSLGGGWKYSPSTLPPETLPPVTSPPSAAAKPEEVPLPAPDPTLPTQSP